MAKQVNCDCGFMVRTETEDELVRHAQLHAKEVHQIDVPREKILEMSRSVESTVTVWRIVLPTTTWQGLNDNVCPGQGAGLDNSRYANSCFGGHGL